MRSIVNLYFAKQVYVMLLIVTFVLIAIDGSFALVNELTYNSQGVGVAGTVEFILWSTPIRFLDYFPVAVLIAVLVTLGRLAANSEITVLMAMGVSKFSVLRRLLAPIVGIVISFYGVMELTIGYFYEKAEAIKPLPSLVVRDGSWHREKDMILHVDRFDKSEDINKLVIYSLQDGKFSQIIAAKSAHQVDSGWALEQAEVARFSETKVNRFQVEELVWPIKIDANLLARLSTNPEKISVFELYIAINYLTRQRIDTSALEQVFWRRVSAPLLTFMMAFLGAMMVFGNPRQSSTGARVFMGIVVGISLRLFQELVRPMVAIFDLAPWITAVLPMVLVALIMLVLFIKHQKDDWLVRYQQFRMRPFVMPRLAFWRK